MPDLGSSGVSGSQAGLYICCNLCKHSCLRVVLPFAFTVAPFDVLCQYFFKCKDEQDCNNLPCKMLYGTVLHLSKHEIVIVLENHFW